MINYLRTNYNDLFDDLFDNTFSTKSNSLMKTDIKENENNFEILMDMPGYNKDNIKISLEKGYLNIEGTIKSESSNENEKNETENNKKKNNYIHRERFYGSVSRSFYVGDMVKEEDIKAAFVDGVLTLTVPKETKQVSTKKFIEIE